MNTPKNTPQSNNTNQPSKEDLEKKLNIGAGIEEQAAQMISKKLNMPRCNCNDEYKTQPCPVHFNVSPQAYNQYDNKTIVTDNDMVQEQVRQWVGYTYKCPECKEPAIMDICKYCANCGVQVILQSRILTDFINGLNQRSTQMR